MKRNCRQKNITFEKNNSDIGVNGWMLKDVPGPLQGAIVKLHEYEKIGQDPEDIAMFLSLYEEKCEEVEILQEQIDELNRRLSTNTEIN